MKKYIAILLTLCLLATMAGCGASASQTAAEFSMDAAAPAAGAADYGWNGSAAAEAPIPEVEYAEAEEGIMEATAAPMAAGTIADNDAANYEASLKIIKTGNLSIESETFDQTDAFIRNTVESYGGILAERSVSGTPGYRWASYTVRIPSASFDDFFYDVTGACTVVSQSMGSEDVTEQYTDLATRLETNRKKYERLLELMDQAETLTDLYQLETEIANVEYEIDWLTGTLNGLDSRVSYSTIYLDVNELSRVSAVPDQPSFSAALSAAFQNGANSALEGFQDLLLFLAYNWFGLLMFFIILAIVIVIVVSRVRRNLKKKTVETPPDDTTTTE